MSKLEVGRMYVDKKGRDVGPMENRPSQSYPFMVGGGVFTYTQDGLHSDVVGDSLNIDFEASEKKFPKEEAMEDISKKFHDNMHVKLRNGVEIMGLRMVDGKPRLTGIAIWWGNGRRDHSRETQVDIVEVLSTPPPLKVKDVELKAGMIVHVPSGGQRVYEVIAIAENLVWLQRGDCNGVYPIKDISEYVVEDVCTK